MAEFSNELATAVIDGGVLELFRTGGVGDSSQRWLTRYLTVGTEVDKKGRVQVAWRRPPAGEEGTLTFDAEHAADAEQMLKVLLSSGATRKE